LETSLILGIPWDGVAGDAVWKEAGRMVDEPVLLLMILRLGSRLSGGGWDGGGSILVVGPKKSERLEGPWVLRKGKSRPVDVLSKWESRRLI
jgi:hypothetical protein